MKLNLNEQVTKQGINVSSLNAFKRGNPAWTSPLSSNATKARFPLAELTGRVDG